MKLPLGSFYNWLHPKPTDKVLSTPITQRQAQDAVEAADLSLHEAQNNRGIVTEKASALRSQKERNNFAYLIEVTMRGNG